MLRTLRNRLAILAVGAVAATASILSRAPQPVLAETTPPCVQASAAEVTRVAFVPSTEFVISAGADGRAVLWSFPDLRRMRDVVTSDSGLISLAVSRNGQRVAMGDAAGNIWMKWLWGNEARQPAVKQTMQNDAALDLMPSGDDTYFFALMLNPSQATPSIRTFESLTLSPSNWFEAAATPSLWSFSADVGTTLIAAAGDTGGIVRWKTPQRLPARYENQKVRFTCTATSPDGRTCFFGDDAGGVWVISEARKQPQRAFTLGQPIASLGIDAQGQFLAIGLGRPSHKEIYRRTSLKQPYVTPTGGPAPIVVMQTATCVQGTGATPTDKEAFRISGPVGGALSVAFSADGKRLLVGGADGTLRVWLITDGRARLLSMGHSNG